MDRITLDGEEDFLLYREGSGGSVEIFDIAVNSERGVGKGRRLVQMLEDVVRGQTHLIFAITRVENLIAQEFYERIGFKFMTVLKDFYRDGHAIMYGKRLRAGDDVNYDFKEEP